MKRTLIGGLCGLLLAGMANWAGAAQPGFGQPAPAAERERPAVQEQPKQDVVAMVNGDAITKQELTNSIQSQVQNQQLTEEDLQRLRQQILEMLIDGRLVEQYVLENGPDVEKDEVEQVIDQFEDQLESQGLSLNQFLVSRGYTKQTMRKRVEGSLAWQKFQQQQVSEEKLQKYFQDRPDEFQAEEYEQARPQVIQAYTAELWNHIVKQMREDAKIQVQLEQRQPTPQQPPGGFPQP